MEHFLVSQDICKLKQMKRWVITNKTLLSCLYKCLNGALPSMKCSIKQPTAKCKTSVYVLTQTSEPSNNLVDYWGPGL